MLKELLCEYNLPSLPQNDVRKNCLEIMQKYEFGCIPEKPETLMWETLDASDTSFGGGKTVPTTVRLYGTLRNGREYSFPIRVCIPKDAKKVPFFVHMNFRPNIPDKYQPTEEIIDNGFAVLSFCYNEVTSDDGDFTNGLAGAFFPDGQRKNPQDPGKIALWAWAAMRVVDYAQKAFENELDFSNIAVTGHSRLGKTALLCGAYDERFKFTFANDAGCAGDALERNKTVFKNNGRGETIKDITKNFPYWFCPEYLKLAEKNSAELPFDQHFLLVCTAPRYLYTGMSELDYWADQRNQFMGLYAASEYYKTLGLPGLICPDRLPFTGESFAYGNIGCHFRPGLHSQNRTDWLGYMNFFKIHMN